MLKALKNKKKYEFRILVTIRLTKFQGQRSEQRDAYRVRSGNAMKSNGCLPDQIYRKKENEFKKYKGDLNIHKN